MLYVISDLKKPYFTEIISSFHVSRAAVPPSRGKDIPIDLVSDQNPATRMELIDEVKAWKAVRCQAIGKCCSGVEWRD